jgi:hypothetical protein
VTQQQQLTLEQILGELPEQAADLIRRNVSVIGKLEQSLITSVVEHFEAGQSSAAEAAIYRSLSPAQRDVWRDKRIDALRIHVDAELAAKAALWDVVQTVGGAALGVLAATGQGFAAAVTAAALRAADRIGSVGDGVEPRG